MQVYADHDLKLAEHCLLILKTGRVLFQYPPSILSDGRRATWVEADMPGREPTASIQTSGPREISLSWTYIVDAANNGWTTEKIAKQVHLIRGYFAQIRDNGDQRNLIVWLRYGLYGAQQPTTCRIKDVNVKHSETMIIPNGDVSKAFPLKTDIVAELRLWNQTDVEDLGGLADITPEWY